MLDLDRAVAIAADLDAPENEEYMRGMVELVATLSTGQEDVPEDFDVRKEEIEARIRREYAVGEWERSKERATREADMAEWHIVHLRSGHIFDRPNYTYHNVDQTLVWRFPEV